MKFMKTLLTASTAVVMLASVGSMTLRAAPAPAPAPGAVPAAENPGDAAIKALVQQLGDADYQTRENAEKKLKEIGAPATDELTKAMDSDDAEVKDRATRLVQNMRREAVRKDFTWKFPFDNNTPLAMPLMLGDGVLYAVAANTAAGNMEVSAIDIRTGKLKGKMTVEGNPISAPVVGENLICVASDKGELSGFDTRTNKLLWKFQCGSAVGAPAMGQGMVVVAGPDKLYAINPVTGKLARDPLALSAGIVGAPAVAADRVYIATGEGNILALETSGKSFTEAWKLEAGGNCTTGPVLAADGTLYAGTSEGLLAVDTQKKAKKWSYAVAGGDDPQEMQMKRQIMIMQRQPQGQQFVNVGGSVPVIENGVAYLSAGGKLQAVDAATGQGKWTFEPDVGQSADAGNDANGRFHNNAIMRRMPFQMGIGMGGGLSAPVIVGKTAYVGAPQGLFALEVKNGLQLWRFPTDTPVLGRPLVANDTLLFGNGVDYGGMGMQVFRGGRVIPPAAGQTDNGQPTYAVFALPVKASSPAIPVAK